MNKKIIYLVGLLFFAGIQLHAQSKLTDTTMIDEIVVTGFQPDDTRHTSLNIESYSLIKLSEKSPFNLSDALAKLPGISQISTGNAIAKPVIRGLYGNRILVLLSGSRFDNQQWQDEHGLGLSQIGIDRVEVIKGPASLLYGSDALGGVINIVEEKPTILGKKLDIGSTFYSNSLGNLSDIGYSNKGAKYWYRFRVGAEGHSDYNDGGNRRVLNSRNSGYYAKVGFGFKKAKWEQENAYNFSYNQYGFILEELNTFFSPDARWTRNMNGPHHIVLLNIVTSQNTFYLKKSLLKFNLGFQSNSRREDEGGGQISLNMHLISVLQNLKWEKDLSPSLLLVLNQQITYENNTNYGGRIIIPDANLFEGNFSGYVKWHQKKVIFESGIGVNNKTVQTFVTRMLNSPGAVVQPFVKNRTTANGMLGLTFNPFDHLTLKANMASGFRSPNLAELSSNGLHEGVYRYEIGDPNLKLEQNINADISAEWNENEWFFGASTYYNRFFNYVYLSPTAEKFYGFPVFRYKQYNATLYGAELCMTAKPADWRGFQWKQGINLTKGILDNGNRLPFIPAYKINTSFRYERQWSTKKVRSFFVEPEIIYVCKQSHPAQFETATPAYLLVHFYAGITLAAKKGNWNIGFNVLNLTNQQYFDHLSRLKYYGLYNQGINFVFSLRKDIQW